MLFKVILDVDVTPDKFVMKSESLLKLNMLSYGIYPSSENDI